LAGEQGEPRDCVTGKCLALPVAAATEAAKTTAAAETTAEVLPRRHLTH